MSCRSYEIGLTEDALKKELGFRNSAIREVL